MAVQRAMTEFLGTCSMACMMSFRAHGEALKANEVRTTKTFSARFPARDKDKVDDHMVKLLRDATQFVVNQRKNAGVLWRAIQADKDGDYITLNVHTDEDEHVTLAVSVRLIAPKQDAASKRLVSRVFSMTKKPAVTVPLKKKK